MSSRAAGSAAGPWPLRRTRNIVGCAGALAGYDVIDGVTLDEYYSNRTDTGLCFTGQDSTYLTFSSTAEGFERTLGTGDCDFDQGDIVLSIDFDDMLKEGEDEPNFDEKVVQGKDLAEQVPALEGFLASMAEG